jgi:polysaccharide export outer membrane protein
MKIIYAILITILSLPFSAWGQVPNTFGRTQQPTVFFPQEEFNANRPSTTPTSLAGQEYRIGRDDLIEVSVFEVPGLGTVSRVTANGKISLPLMGPVEVADHTVQEIEQTIEEALRDAYINDPHVTVFIREYASQPVSVIGAVRVPGIYQIKGQKKLLDMLALAQGLDQTGAGKSIQVLRHDSDAPEESRTITISTEDLFQNGKSELNIPIQPGDVINVLQSGSVFVIGEVMRPGEFVLRQGKDITAAQAVALGGGFSREAKKQDCMIIRIHRDGSKEELPVNIGKILEGSLRDVPLLPNDILFVPANKVKVGLMRVLDTTIATLSARVIYRF